LPNSEKKVTNILNNTTRNNKSDFMINASKELDEEIKKVRKSAKKVINALNP
jgi:hypothetical protein